MCLAGLLNGDEKSIEAAKAFFKTKFPAETPLALISSRKDHIARPDDIRRLFVISTVAREVRDYSCHMSHVWPTVAGGCACCNPSPLQGLHKAGAWACHPLHRASV